MRIQSQRPSRSRSAFTLIEMIIVVAIVLLLATIAITFMPKVQERQRATQGAVQLQNWLLAAKQWALRDQAPRGIRLMVPSNNYVNQMLYIEQPDDWAPVAGGMVNISGTASAGMYADTSQYTATATVPGPPSNVDFTGGYATSGSNGANWPVQIGDYFENTSVSPYQLSRITSVNFNSVVIDATPHYTVTPPPQTNQSFRIVRKARPRLGESPLLLPANVAIDINTNLAGAPWNAGANTVPTGSNTIDILFSPLGGVVGWTAAADKIQLWVRDISEDQVSSNGPFNGEQTVITIYVRTGFISAQRVDPTLSGTTGTYSQPYSFTQDGRSSGL